MALLSGARLYVLRKSGDGVIRDVPIRTSFVKFGSEVQCTIRLKSELTEQLHCKIFVKNDKVMIANYSSKNPISVEGKVITRRGILSDGNIIEVCGTRFRWQFDESLLQARTEKTKKGQPTPTSSKFSKPRRTTMVVKKLQIAEGNKPPVASTGSGRKSGPKRSRKTPTYTLPKNNKQLLKNIKKRFTMHSVMVDHHSDDEEIEEDEHDQNESTSVKLPLPATPTKSTTPNVSKNNTPFYTPEPEKENQTPVSIGKTPRTPKTPSLENSAMMILSYTPVIGPRAKTNLQKTPATINKARTPLSRSGYLTVRNENVSMSNTPAKSKNIAKVGNSMYLIDLTSPATSNNSSFTGSLTDTSFSSSSGPIDLTTPPPNKMKTPSSTVAKSAQKGLLRSALKNASKTPISALRSRLARDTPKSVTRGRLDDSIGSKAKLTPTKIRNSIRPVTPVNTSKGKLKRESLKTLTVDSPSVSVTSGKSGTPNIVPVSENGTFKSTPTVMTTDELFDTLVGRSSVKKTYTRKSESPKKMPSPLVVAEGSSDLPKTDVDLWVESVVAAVATPNRTTQVRLSQYSDITPHESFSAEPVTTNIDHQQIETNKEAIGLTAIADELDKMDDKPSIPSESRKSHTPFSSKIVRSLGNKRQTIGNFFSNMFGKLTVSPVTRVSITDEHPSEDIEGSHNHSIGHESDGSEEVYHDSESDHPPESDIVLEPGSKPSPNLRHSLRNTRKFIGNALTSLNTSRLMMDNTEDIDESLLLRDGESIDQNEDMEENYDLTDLSVKPDNAHSINESHNDHSRLTTPAKSNRNTLSRDFRAEISPFVAGNHRLAPISVSTPTGRRSSRQRSCVAVDISPLTASLLNTPVTISPQPENSTTPEQTTSMRVDDEPDKTMESSVIVCVTNGDNPAKVTAVDCTPRQSTTPSSAKGIANDSSPDMRLSSDMDDSTTQEQHVHTENVSFDNHSILVHSNLVDQLSVVDMDDPENEKEKDTNTSNKPVTPTLSTSTRLQRRRTTESVPRSETKQTLRHSIAIAISTSPSSNCMAIGTKPLNESEHFPMHAESMNTLGVSQNDIGSLVGHETADTSVENEVQPNVTINSSVVSREASPDSSITTHNASNKLGLIFKKGQEAIIQEAYPLEKVVDDQRNQSTGYGTAFNTPVRRGRSSLRQRGTISASNRISMTVGKQIKKSSNGTPLLKKAILAMCTPTRTLRNNTEKTDSKKRTTMREACSSRSSTIGEITTLGENSEHDSSTLAIEETFDSFAESTPNTWDAITSSSSGHTPRTRRTASKTETPVSSPRFAPDEISDSTIPNTDSATSTSMTESTPTGRSFNHTGIDLQNESTSTENINGSEHLPTEFEEQSLVGEEDLSVVATSSLTSGSPRRTSFGQRQTIDGDDRLSLTTEKRVEKRNTGTPLLRKAIFAMCTPTRTSRSSLKKSITQERTPARTSSTIDEFTLNDDVEDDGSRLDIVDNAIVSNSEDLEASVTIPSPSTKTSKVAAPLLSPIFVTVKKPSYGRKSVLEKSASLSTTLEAKEQIDAPVVECESETEDNNNRDVISQEDSASMESMNESEQLCTEESEKLLKAEAVLSPSTKTLKVEAPLTTPMSVTVETPSSGRKSVLQKSAFVSTTLVDEEQIDAPVVECESDTEDNSPDVTSELSISNEISTRTSRRLTKDSTLVRQSLEPTIIESLDESASMESENEPKQLCTEESEELLKAKAIPSPMARLTRSRASKSNTPVTTPGSVNAKRSVDTQTPSSLRKSLLKTPQQVEQISEATVEQISILSITSETSTPVKNTDISRSESTPMFKTPRPVRGTRTPLSVLKKTPATPALINSDQTESQINDPSTPSELSSFAVAELFSTSLDDKKSKSAPITPTIRKPSSPQENVIDKNVTQEVTSTESSVVFCPGLLQHLCERVITLEHEMENLEDSSQQSFDITAGNNTAAQEGMKLLETPAATSTVRKKLRSSIASTELNKTIDNGQVLNTPVGESSLMGELSEQTESMETSYEVSKKLQDSKDTSTCLEEHSLDVDSSMKNSSVNMKDVNNQALKTLASAPKRLSKHLTSLHTATNEEKTDTTVDMEGVQQMLVTRTSMSVRGRSTRSSTTVADDTMHLEGVRKLLQTPVAIKGSHNDSCNLEGIDRMLKTPCLARTKKVANKDISVNLEGVEQLLKTPSSVHEQLSESLKSTSVATTEKDSDSTVELEGVQQMLATPAPVTAQRRNTRSPTTVLDNILHSKGARKRLHTPVAVKGSPNDSCNLEGIDQMLKTPSMPRLKKPAANDISVNLEGVEGLFKTPSFASIQLVGELKSPCAATIEEDIDTTVDMEGVPQMLETPSSKSVQGRSTRSSTIIADNTMHLEGVRKLLQTPVAVKESPNNSFHLEGIDQMLRTPSMARDSKLAVNNTSVNLEGVEQLLKTPSTSVSQKLPITFSAAKVNENTCVSMEEMPQMLEHSIVKEAPVSAAHTRASTVRFDDTINLEGVKMLLKTPRALKETPNNSINLEGVEQMLKTPAASMKRTTRDASVDLEGVRQLLQTSDVSVCRKHPDLTETTENTNREASKSTESHFTRSSLAVLDPVGESFNETCNLEGVQQMIKTPSTGHTKNGKVNETSVNLEGVEQLLKTPTVCVPNQLSAVPELASDTTATIETKFPNDTYSFEGIQQQLETPGTDRKSSRISITSKAISPSINSVSQELFESSDVEEMFNVQATLKEENIDLSIQHMRTSASTRRRTTRSSTSSNDTNFEGVQQLLKTPIITEKTLHSTSVNCQNLTEVGVLVETSVSVKNTTLPKTSGVGNFEGLQQLFKTPIASSTVRKPLRYTMTPSILDESSNLEGVQQLLQTPLAKQTVESLNETGSLEGVQKLTQTPTHRTLSIEANLEGVQQMFKTPITLPATRKLDTTKPNLNESINFEGVQQLLSTPLSLTRTRRSNKNRENISANLEGLEQMMKTPANKRNSTAFHDASPSGSVCESPSTLSDVRQRLPTSGLNTPEVNSCLVTRETSFSNTTSLEEIDQLKTPVTTTSTTETTSTTPLNSVQQLFKTPNPPPSALKRQVRHSKASVGKRGVDNSETVSEISDVLRTTEVSSTTDNLNGTPLNDTVNIEGLRQLLKTPTLTQQPILTVFEESVNLEGVEQLLKTPVTSQNTPCLMGNQESQSVSEPIVDSDTSSNIFSPPEDGQQSSSAVVNLTGIIQMLETSVNDRTTENTNHTPYMNVSEQTPDVAPTIEGGQNSKPTSPAISAKMSVGVSVEIGTPSQRMRRKLYTKNDPDDKTPERVKTSVVRPVTNNEYLHILDPTASSDSNSEEKKSRPEKKITNDSTDSESENYSVEEKIEPVRKILPSRASRRNIKTLSEDELAGASPELKYVKPTVGKSVEKPTVVVPPTEFLRTIDEESALIIQDLSAGRRKVMFNEQIQIKEINSPAIVGEIIQKVSRGRGGKHQKAVQVIVTQSNNEQPIKSARRENKKIEEESLRTNEDHESEHVVENFSEADPLKRSRRCVKKVNYAELLDVDTKKTDEAPKRSKRGANKLNKAEDAETNFVPSVEKQHSRRGVKKVDMEKITETSKNNNQPLNTNDDVGESTANATESSLSKYGTFEEACTERIVEEPMPNPARQAPLKAKPASRKTSSRTKSKSAEAVTNETVEDEVSGNVEKNDVESPEIKKSSSQSKGNATEPSSIAIVTIQAPQETLEKEKDEEEVIPKRTRRAPAKSKAAPKPTRSRSKKTEILVSESEEDRVVDAEAIGNHLEKTNEDKSDASTKNEPMVAAKSQRLAKKTNSESKSSKGRTNKTDTMENTNTQQESLQITETNPADSQVSHDSIEDTNHATDKPAAKRTRRAPGKHAKEIVPKNVSAKSSSENEMMDTTNNTEIHEDTDNGTTSSRGRRGAKKTTAGSRSVKSSNKDEIEPSESVEQHEKKEKEKTPPKSNKRVPATKSRQRLAAANKIIDDDSITPSQVEVQTSPTMSIVKAAVVEQFAADSTTEGESQPAKRGRNARKPPASKTSVGDNTVSENEATAMPPPAMIITPEPIQTNKKRGNQSSKTATTRRGRQKAVEEEHRPELHLTVEESLNESRMVKMMLPSSHTSTPLLQNEAASRPRSRRADSQTDESEPKIKRTRTRTVSRMNSMEESHEQPKTESNVPTILEEDETTEVNDTPDIHPSSKSRVRKNPPTKRARGKRAEESQVEEIVEVATKRARKTAAMNSVEESLEQPKTESNVPTIVEEGETTEVNDTPDIHPSSKSRARKNPPTKRARGKTAEESEVEIVEVAPKRARKTAAMKLQAEQPKKDEEAAAKTISRNRPGAKSSKQIAETSTTQTTDSAESEDVATKPSRNKTATARRKKGNVVEPTEDNDVEESTSSRRRPTRSRK